MRGALFIVSFLASAYACGGNDGTDFGAPIGSGARSGAPGGGDGGTNAAGTAGENGGGGVSGSATGGGGTSAGTSGTSGTGATGGDAAAGAGAALNAGAAGAAGDEGGAGAGGAGGAPPTETCPGTLSGCVIDWAGTFGTLSDDSLDGVGQAAVFGDAQDGDPSYGPRGITGDGTYVYVGGSDCIRRIEIATGTVDTIAGACGSPGYVNDVGTDARFNFVDAVATDGTTLWVVDAGNYVIRAIALDSMTVTRLTGTLGSPGYDDDNNPNGANFQAPRGLVYQNGYLYLVEQTSNAVRRIDPDSGAVTTVAGPNADGDTDGMGDDAAFRGPRKIGGDGDDLFVADTENHLLRQLVLGGGASSTNTVSTLAGDKTGAPNTPGWVDATGQAAQFNEPRGITFDETDLIVADFVNCAIRKVTLPGAVVTTIAGSVEDPCTHAVGVGTDARFNQPVDVHYDPGTGDLFILEDSVVRRMYYK